MRTPGKGDPTAVVGIPHEGGAGRANDSPFLPTAATHPTQKEH